MKRLTIRNSDGSVSQPTTTTFEVVMYRLAAYEDIMPLERAQELVQAEQAGRLVVLPKVEEADRQTFAEDLKELFDDLSNYDPSVGIFGWSHGEAELANALMTVLTRQKAEAAEPCMSQ